MMQITSWPIQQCKIANDNFNQIFNIQKSININSTFIKPFIARKNGELAEILIGKIDSIQGINIPIYFIPEESSQFQILQYVSDYFLFDAELNNSIISNLLNYVEKIDINETDKKIYISTKLKISLKPKVVELFKKFNFIDPLITDFLIMKKAPLKVWEYITNFDKTEQNFLIKLLKTTKPSMSNFLEIVENLSEYQLTNTNLDVSELEYILDDDIDNKLSRIREFINIKRYPTLTSHRDEISKIFNQISKPNNMNLQYDQSFEKKEIRGSFTISKENDINDLKRFFSDKNIEIINKTLKKL